MSEIGQQLEFYDELYEQAELIDKVLLEIKANLNSMHIENLGKMLISLGEEDWQTSPARLFIILRREFKRSQRLEWAAIGNQLLSNTFDNETVNKLEDLALALEREQVDVMARIRGC